MSASFFDKLLSRLDKVDPAREADVVTDALVAYLDTGAAPGTIMLENTFVAGEGE